MLRAEADARSQIAAELHDDTIQVMTASMLGIERVLKALERRRPAHMREVLERRATRWARRSSAPGG